MSRAGGVLLSEGAELEPRSFGPLARTDIVRYQGASGDFHPAHHDDDYARQHGYPGAFSVGMLHAGILATYVTDLLGPANIRRFAVRFREVAFPGDVLTCTARVARLYEAGQERRVDLDLHCTRQGGGVAVEGSATFVLPA